MAVQEQKAAKHAEYKQRKADQHKDPGVEQVGITQGEEQKPRKCQMEKVAVPQRPECATAFLVCLDDDVHLLGSHDPECNWRA